MKSYKVSLNAEITAYVTVTSDCPKEKVIKMAAMESVCIFSFYDYVKLEFDGVDAYDVVEVKC